MKTIKISVALLFAFALSGSAQKSEFTLTFRLLNGQEIKSEVLTIVK